MVTKRCVSCGRLFQAKSNAKTCSLECRKNNNRKKNTENHKQAYDDNKIKRQIRARQSLDLVDDARRARELDISYGLLKANEYLARQQRASKRHKSRLEEMVAKQHSNDYEFRKQQFIESIEQYLLLDRGEWNG